MYCCNREEAVFLFPFSESIMFMAVVVYLLFLASRLVLALTETLHLCLPFTKRGKDREIDLQVNLYTKENPTSHMSTPTLPC